MDENLLSILFGQTGAPVRRHVELRATYDDEGHPRTEVLGGESFVLSDEGSIDRVELTRDRFYSCGCPTQTEIGGQCGECNRISCVKCLRRCSNPNCREPLCIFHVTHVADSNGSTAPLCAVCGDEFRWKALVSRVTLGLLPPARL